MCLRSESWAFIAPAFWHGPWSTTASLSLGWAVPDMACSEFTTGRTASCLVVCQRPVALSLTSSRPLFRQPSPPSCSTPFQSHPHAPPTRPCDKRMSFSLAHLVTTVSQPSLLSSDPPTNHLSHQPLGHSSLPQPDPISSYPSHPPSLIAHSQNSRLSAATSMTSSP